MENNSNSKLQTQYSYGPIGQSEILCQIYNPDYITGLLF